MATKDKEPTKRDAPKEEPKATNPLTGKQDKAEENPLRPLPQDVSARNAAPRLTRPRESQPKEVEQLPQPVTADLKEVDEVPVPKVPGGRYPVEGDTVCYVEALHGNECRKATVVQVPDYTSERTKEGVAVRNDGSIVTLRVPDGAQTETYTEVPYSEHGGAKTWRWEA